MFEGHSHWEIAAAFSPDGRRALSGSYDKSVILWEVESGSRLRILEGHTEQVYSVCFSPDVRRALSAGWDMTVILWNLETGGNIVRRRDCRSQLPSGLSPTRKIDTENNIDPLWSACVDLYWAVADDLSRN